MNKFLSDMLDCEFSHSLASEPNPNDIPNITFYTPKTNNTKIMSKLAKAIIKVMQAVKGIEKNSTVGEGNYSYKGVNDKDVKEVYSKAMAANGLCILPIDIQDSIEVSTWEDKYKNRKKQVFCSVKTKYLLLHESGESQEIAGYGHGVDSQDKAAGKATTYAMKYALLYTFMTPTGKIDDSDSTHSEEIEVPQVEDKRKSLANNQVDSAINRALELGWTIEDVEKEVKITASQRKKIQEALTNKPSETSNMHEHTNN